MKHIIICPSCRAITEIENVTENKFICPECGETWTYEEAYSKEMMNEIDEELKSLKAEIPNLETKMTEDNGVVDFKKAVMGFSSLCFGCLILAAFDDFHGELDDSMKILVVSIGVIGALLCAAMIPLLSRSYKKRQTKIADKIKNDKALIESLTTYKRNRNSLKNDLYRFS